MSYARNEKRHADVNIIINSVYHYSLHNKEPAPSEITNFLKEICKTDASDSDCDADSLVNLSVLTSNTGYIFSMPEDPKKTTENGTGYYIKKSINNRITVNAPFAEDGEIISVTR